MAASVLGLPRIAAARCASRAHTRVGTARPDVRVASHDTCDEHERSANRDSEHKNDPNREKCDLAGAGEVRRISGKRPSPFAFS